MRSATHSYFRFLARVLLGLTPTPNDLAAASWSWEELVATASDHAVVPAIARRLRTHSEHLKYSSELSDFFSAYSQLNALRNQQSVTELEQHAAFLNEIGIEPVALKGMAYLLEGVYEHKEDRLLLDIDLLVPANRLDDAYAQFLFQGFRPDIPDARAFTRLHKPTLVREESIPVELHDQLLHRSNDLLDPAGVIARSQAITLGSAKLRIPSPEDQIVHLIVHSQVSHGYDQRIWPPLRAQYDLFLLMEHFGRSLDWPSIRQRFSDAGWSALLDLHLLQVHTTLGVPLPYETNPNWPTQLRWARRKLLWKWPWLRFADPLYAFRMGLLPRLLTAVRLWHVPGGRRYLLETPLKLAFYKRLFSFMRPF